VVTNVNVTNSRGWTALMFAARNGRRNVVRFLIDSGYVATSLSSYEQYYTFKSKFSLIIDSVFKHVVCIVCCEHLS
jgi:ankyrin repeat protein